MVISYERAKAESLGLQAKGGLMERAERFVFLGIGCAFGILVPVLWVMLVLTAVTATQRFVIVWRQADRPVRPPRARRESRRERRPFSSPGGCARGGRPAGPATGPSRATSRRAAAPVPEIALSATPSVACSLVAARSLVMVRH
jgi:hypothetical protein